MGDETAHIQKQSTFLNIRLLCVVCVVLCEDANTKKWLRQHIDPVFGFPSIMRFSWKTCDKLLEEQTVPVQFPELLDERQQAVLYKKRAKIWQERFVIVLRKSLIDCVISISFDIHLFIVFY